MINFRSLQKCRHKYRTHFSIEQSLSRTERSNCIKRNFFFFWNFANSFFEGGSNITLSERNDIIYTFSLCNKISYIAYNSIFAASEQENIYIEILSLVLGL